MKMRKRRGRSRYRKVPVRRRVAVARKPKRILGKAFKKVLRKVRLVKRKSKIRRSAIARKLADEHMRNLLLEIAGEKALAVAGALEEPLSDEELAGACKIKLSEVRAVLNKLHSYGLTAYERTRDKDSGWYSYLWSLSLDKAGKFLEKKKVAVERLPEGGFDFYSCSSCKKGEGVLIPFEVAFENRFRCLDCGAPLAFVERKEMTK